MSRRSPPRTSGARAFTEDAAAWSRYWARGALHSCPGAFRANYSGELGTLWANFFASLPDDARLLDIGTGNGALAFIARETAAKAQRLLRIEAIDAADIDPGAAAAAHGLTSDGITFRPHTRCEATGYGDASFDAVSSQYALEYSAVDETLAELARVVKPGGQCMFVIHHAGSRALATARAELAAFHFLQRESGLVAAARRFIAPLSRAASAAELERITAGRDTRNEARSLQQLLTRTVQAARSMPHASFLEAVAAQVSAALEESAAGQPAAGVERLDVLGAELAAHQHRLAMMTRVAHNAEDIERLAQALAQAGLPAQPASELRQRGDDLLGWVLQATRR